MVSGVYIRTKETKRKMKANHKGMSGKKHSKKTRDKIKKAKKGKLLSEKHKRKLSKAHQGEKNPFWKGGISPKNKIIRRSIEFRLWRETVFARDNWTCQKYGIKGCKLHPHHIQNFAEFPELRFAIDNGITFSEKAHKEFHKKFGKRNNTKEQLIEFLR